MDLWKNPSWERMTDKGTRIFAENILFNVLEGMR